MINAMHAGANGPAAYIYDPGHASGPGYDIGARRVGGLHVLDDEGQGLGPPFYRSSGPA